MFMAKTCRGSHLSDTHPSSMDGVIYTTLIPLCDSRDTGVVESPLAAWG